MLDSNDLQAIGELIHQSEERTQKSIAALELRTQEAIAASEVRTQEAISASEARTQEAISALEARTQEAIAASEARAQEANLDLEARMKKHMQDTIRKSESMLLDEMERYDQKNEKRFTKIEQDIGYLKDICRLTKFEHDTTEILIHSMEKLDKRLCDLEAQMA